MTLATIACLVGVLATAQPPAPDARLARVEALTAEARALQAAARLPAALRKFEAALREAERVLGPDHAGTERPLENLASVVSVLGRHRQAAALYERLLRMREAEHGPDHITVARALDRVAHQYWLRGEIRRAEPLFMRALAIHEKVLAPDDDQLAVYLTLLGAYYQTWHFYARAAELHRRGLALYERKYGPKSARLINSLFQMAWLARTRGDVAGAEAMFQRILAILDEDPATDPATRATFLEQLANVHRLRGEDARAEPLYARAEAIYRTQLAEAEAEHGPDHALTLLPVIRLATSLLMREQWARSKPLLQRVIDSYRRTYGPEHPAVGGYEINLSRVEQALGHHREARRLIRHAMKLERRFLGRDRATSSAMLAAHFDHEAGRYADAIALYRQVGAAFEKTYGAGHHHVGYVRERRAFAEWARGRAHVAVDLLASSLDPVERQIEVVLGGGTERDRRAFMARYAHHTDLAVTLHTVGQPGSQKAALLALTTALRRKGRLLDAVADSFSGLYRRLSGDDKEVLEQLASARSALASLVIRGPGGPDTAAEHTREIAALAGSVRRLEAALSSRSAEFRAQSQPVSVGAVQAALPEASALVELVSYRPLDPRGLSMPHDPAGLRRSGPARYAAYVLLAGRGPVTWVDLGPAALIDADAARLREALASPLRDDVQVLARVLDERVMRPIRKLLGPARRVFLAPDGALNLVPFGALVDEHDNFLIRTYTFTYLTSGRDLLRLRVQVEREEAPVVVANPLFDTSGAPDPSPRPSRGRRADALASMRWSPLPETATEAEALQALLPGARMFVGAEATEAALKAVSGPQVLHVATHGFFLGRGDDPDPPAAGSEASGPGQNPLLRSGLVLSGANQLISGAEDGVLTALEASGLDLWGTQLVVLSACETGLGQVESGEGVFGLRRALVIAGSESQVMSLWQVDDEATRALMVAFYKRLAQALGRTDALRQSQLLLLGAPATRHPYYWASFIASGQWAPMRR